MPANRWQLYIKYGLDRIVSAVLLFLLTMPMTLIALLILMDDGPPVFFRQQRMGYRCKPFSIWKFRTMVLDADRLLDPDGRVRQTRITRTGRWLRITSLDELPQLINILRGEMSFIGPRPGLLEHYSLYTEEQRGRYAMKPGVTGLAQVSGRNMLAWSQRIVLDLQYIEQYTLWLDFKILLRTPTSVAMRKNIALDRDPRKVDFG